MIDIRIHDHRLERVVGAAGREFMPDVLLPKSDKVVRFVLRMLSHKRSPYMEHDF
jgi:hypothetical protein